MAKMQPPGAPTVAIAAAPKNGKMPPPGEAGKPDMDENGKVSPAEATIVRSDQHCIDCKNYDPTSGECAKISGSYDPQDACVKYFDAIGADEPDDDDMGGAPDGDTDDVGGQS